MTTGPHHLMFTFLLYFKVLHKLINCLYLQIRYSVPSLYRPSLIRRPHIFFITIKFKFQVFKNHTAVVYIQLIPLSWRITSHPYQFIMHLLSC